MILAVVIVPCVSTKLTLVWLSEPLDVTVAVFEVFVPLLSTKAQSDEASVVVKYQDSRVTSQKTAHCPRTRSSSQSPHLMAEGNSGNQYVVKFRTVTLSQCKSYKRNRLNVLNRVVGLSSKRTYCYLLFLMLKVRSP